MKVKYLKGIGMKKVLLWIIFSTALFADIKVISNENRLGTISQKKLADLYLGKIDNINGIKVIPIDNNENYKEFYRQIIKKTPKQLRAYWMREMYEGTRIPPKKMSTQEIKNLMKHRMVIVYGKTKLDGTIIVKIN